MVLVLGSIQVQVQRSKLVLEQGSILVLVLELGSKLALELGSKRVLVLGSKRVLVLGSMLVLVHSNRCHDDDDDDLLQRLEQRTRLRPTQPKLESQTSWSYLLTKESLVGRAYKYTSRAPPVNRADKVE